MKRDVKSKGGSQEKADNSSMAKILVTAILVNMCALLQVVYIDIIYMCLSVYHMYMTVSAKTRLACVLRETK